MQTLINHGYTTVKDFAEKKGISVAAVYLGIKRGKYQGKKIGSLVLVRE
jgi:hypothetical protein